MSLRRWGLLSVLGLILVMVFGATSVFGSSGEGHGNGRAGDVVPDSYIVILQDGASADAVAKRHGVALGRKFTAVFNGFSGKVPPGRVRALRDDSSVLSVAANRVLSAHAKPEGAGKGGGKNKAPSVNILSPTTGATFAVGANIAFQGTANDNQDGDLTSGLVWTSDVDGQIGTGGSFSTTLTAGGHTVTAAATDSGDKTGSDSISITVGSVSNQVVPSGVSRIGADTVVQTGAGVGVAIVDSGIDFGHSDIDDNVAPECFFDWSVGGSCQDDAGHGTHVAGIVAAEDNTDDVVGVAPGALYTQSRFLTVTATARMGV